MPILYHCTDTPLSLPGADSRESRRPLSTATYSVSAGAPPSRASSAVLQPLGSAAWDAAAAGSGWRLRYSVRTVLCSAPAKPPPSQYLLYRVHKLGQTGELGLTSQGPPTGEF